MRTLSFASLFLVFSVPRLTPPAQQMPQLSVPHDSKVTAHAVSRRGRWYMADNGHAVYCVGPVRTLPGPDGQLQRVATYCRGQEPMVRLHD